MNTHDEAIEKVQGRIVLATIMRLVNVLTYFTDEELNAVADNLDLIELDLEYLVNTKQPFEIERR